MVPEAGQFVGPYEILGQIGAGGMGVVYRAWDERLHREVAVKLLREEYETPNLRERFLIEARAASALNHPNICTIFDLGEQWGEPYLVMEMLTGQTVKERLAQTAPGTPEIVRVASETADALAWAHAKGVIHRDIKPANIFLLNKPGGQTQAKVLDFGLAKMSAASRSGRAQRSIDLTTSGSTVGTLAYMSPEQARGEALDARSDLFSLGVVMYEMCTRRVPFRGATSAMVFTALLTQPPEPIRNWNSAIPRDLERVVMRLLAKDRAERFQSAHELFDELRRLTLKGEGDWLRKLPRGVVPLVQAVDPVARARRGWRPEVDEESPVSRGTAHTEPPDESDNEEQMLRPRRLPRKESGPRESAFGVPGPETAARRPEAEPREASSGASAGRATPAPTQEVKLDRPTEGVRRSAATVVQPTVEGKTESGQGNGSGRVAVVPGAVVGADLPGGSRADAGVAARSVAQARSPAHGAEVDSRGELAADTEARVEVVAGSRVEEVVAAADPVAHAAGSATEQADPMAEPVRGAGPKMVDRTREPMRSPRTVRRVESRGAVGVVAPEQVPAGREEGVPEEPKSRARLAAAGIVAVLVLASLVVLQLHRGGLAGVVLRPGDAVLLTPVENRTGERDLDHSVAEGLELALLENTTLHIEGLAAFRAGARQIATETHGGDRQPASQAVAGRIGARAYLYEEVEHTGAGYLLRVSVVDTRSNDRMASLAETAEGRDQLPAAVTRMSVSLRRKLGEGEEVGTHPGTPLAQQATGDLTALESYADGRMSAEDGRAADAVVAYRRAVAKAPGFVLAQVQLAWISAAQGAEVEAAEAASAAASAATRRMGDRVLQMALYTRQALADRDLTAATATARTMVAARPQDVEALLALTRVMRLSGHRTESLLSAEQTLRRDPSAGEAYDEAAHALIGLDRYGDALRMREEARTAGVVCACGGDAAAALNGGEPEQATEVNDLAEMRERALVLDNGGQFRDGLAVWKQAAAEAQSREGLGSAAAGLMDEAALSRALAGRCGESEAAEGVAANLVQGQGAIFRRSVARALCGGDTDVAEAALSRGAGLHSQAVEYFIPLLRAAIAIHAQQTLEGLSALSHVHEQRDATSLLLYLRGTAHLADDQEPLATEDFNEIRLHRGEAFLSGSAVFVPALEGLERAQTAAKDKAGAAATHALLEELLSHADSPVRNERSARARTARGSVRSRSPRH